jgi:hypothetical protein
MKLEAGKFYRTRNGEKVKILETEISIGKYNSVGYIIREHRDGDGKEIWYSVEESAE